MQSRDKPVSLLVVYSQKGTPATHGSFLWTSGKCLYNGVQWGEQLPRWLALCPVAGFVLMGVSENEELPSCAAVLQVFVYGVRKRKANSVTQVSVWPAAHFGSTTAKIKNNKTNKQNKSQGRLPGTFWML